MPTPTLVPTANQEILPFKSQHIFLKLLCSLAVSLSLLLSSCKKDTVLTNSSAKLSFSTTKVAFDTVFTTVGSTVQGFLVRNTYSQPIVISSIKLAGNYLSPFKINVDGVPGTTFQNVRIPAKDSIYVFVTCTINPTNKNNPIVIEDSLIFTTNGNVQNVYLEAWGQDAHFFKPNIFPSSGPAYSIIPCSASHWINDKPYVIFGYAVDTGCTLTIDSGVHVYMHNNAVLYISKGATLIMGNLGAKGHEVVFQGDRLEPEYKYEPGQWGEIQLSPGSINNTISWSIIKNGSVGIEVDTVGNSSPTLQIDHTIIKSMSLEGLLGLDTYIVGDDLLIEDCQYYCLNLSIGGKYRFNQCTFANYWSYGQRQTSLLLINNHYTDIFNTTHSYDMDSATFHNCLLYGSATEEIALDNVGPGKFNYFFDYSFLKTQQSLVAPHFATCSVADPQFTNTQEPPFDDYHVSGTSPAKGIGTIFYDNFALDLDGTGRSYPSTVGSYEK